MKFWLTTYLILLSFLFLLLHEWVRLPSGNLELFVLDVGQGDAILVTTPGNQRILIDGGPDLSLLERLGEELPFFERTIDLLILSHPDRDHIIALPAILNRYDVHSILMTGAWKDSSFYHAFLDAAKKHNTEVLIADSHHDLDLGEGVLLDILWPIESLFGVEHRKANNYSIVAKLVWKDHEILLTGDIEEKAEMALLKSGADLSADILKVPHHGSKTSSSTGFLLAVSPELALISAGRENRFGHPHPQVTRRYESLNIPVRTSQVEGTISLRLE